ncbi:uncharacterized protein JN550_009818 [Neoarthrinium moseri]|uniref:uncharacterized protein n=1 Tax=Neoarthrinium moseri TaxID=1658444 RepID=UPI001FDC8BC1|nr:uncharacterized protein JN550_009818 [Neoarthrinium moseri]KAI1863082.1 hypothetical protein JN550_009818 [Neoarthrinium moseri]
MDHIPKLLDWAETKGIKLDGISPKRLAGRGVGVVATRDLKTDDIILEVPTSCHRSIDTVPKTVRSTLPKEISVQGLLATDLALEDSSTSQYSIWNSVCPTPEDFTSIPLLWPQALQALLPGPAAKLLAAQQAKLARDWAAASAAFPDLAEDRFRYGWLLANTRTFFYPSPALKRRQNEGRMVLQPVADLLNHAEEGCNVAFDAKSFVVRANREYEEGEEVRICYGRHGCDFLMVEYGFVLDPNRWDEFGLDDVILPKLTRQWKERLKDRGFLGRYVLDREQVCYRTQVAVRTLCCGVGEWMRFADGEDGGEESQDMVNELLAEMLGKYRKTIRKRIDEATHTQEGEECQRELLAERWRQIDRLVEATVDRLQD